MPEITMTNVENSSNITARGYDPETQTMRVTFKGGATYELLNIDPALYLEFKQASSAGKFYAQRFRYLPSRKV